MAKAGDSQQFLQPPVLAQIRNEDKAARMRMERSVSQEIRDERADLKEAAEHSFNVVVDIGLDGTVRWVSPSWQEIIGTPVDTVQGKPIAEIILDKTNPFAGALTSIQEDDSKSQTVRIRVRLGHDSILLKNTSLLTAQRDFDGFKQDGSEQGEDSVVLEGQGMMVFERPADNAASIASDKIEQIESHMMWMLRPAVPPREITIDLPDQVVDALGFGADVLAQHLTALAEAEVTDPSEIEEPPPLLCRICERQITPWWFEKHSELCMQEHEAESRLQMAHETLSDHRNAIVSVLDALEARRARPISGDFSNNQHPPAEYKGLSIGPANSPSSSGSVSGRRTPMSSTPPSSREVSTARPGHSRQRSFTVRRPLARIVELILDLCDTAIEIKTPILNDSRQSTDGEFRTQSPGSEAHISQVLQWQTPGSLDNEEGLVTLNRDTEALARAKVEATIQYRNIIEYSERIRLEFHQLIQDCIEAAIEKARQIREGRASDSSDSEEETTPAPMEMEEEPTPHAEPIPHSLPPSMIMDTSIAERLARRQSVAISTGSNSPVECPTPRSNSVNPGPLSRAHSTNKRHSLFGGSDAGHESDTSSVFSSSRRTESPSQDSIPSRTHSSRDRKRRSLKLPPPGISSPRRAPSPGRAMPPPSPLRLAKARMPSGQEVQSSPITSPTMNAGVTGKNSPTDHRRQSSVASSLDTGSRPPRSPRLSAVAQPQQKPVQPSIKDFEIIKPISKGAFGSVYLSKKKSTGDYYAIKVLKKSDMVAKNQVTNVKAERAIMMFQGESDFVAKLYWTFSSKDYLYLVMEYLNGGDCASLIKVLGGLPEDWAKKYLAEVILGVEHLHSRGIVHRDLKPDNLLIDPKGHLKLTDFGLSRMGLIGRQKRLQKSPDNAVPDLLKQGPFARPQSMASSRSASFDMQGSQSPGITPLMTPDAGSLPQPSYFSLGGMRESLIGREHSRRQSGYRSDSGGSDTFSSIFKQLSLEEQTPRGEPIQEEVSHHGGGIDFPDPYFLTQTISHTSQTHGTPPNSTPPLTSGMPPPALALFDPQDQNRRFVGTPDYLAPETIKGVGQDEMSDWWSIGCILFEFLYGYPPFHADTPELVFENILNRRIDWPSEEEYLVSDEARNLMSRLMMLNPKERLGSNDKEQFSTGGEEIRKHPWFDSVNWDSLLEDEAQFVPAPENPEDTEYFDTRGATLQTFAEELEDTSSSNPTPGADYPDRPHDALSRIRQQVNSVKRNLLPLHIPAHVRDNRSRRLSEPAAGDDFGAFSFKNLPVLDKANKDVIQKLRAEALQAGTKPSTSSSQPAISSPGPIDSSLLPSPLKRTMSTHAKQTRSASPSNLGHLSASPNKMSQPTSPLLVQFSVGSHHERRKTSGSSNGSLQPPGPASEVPRLPVSQSFSGTTTNSPLKSRPSSMQVSSPDRSLLNQRIMNVQTRNRSQTVGSQESEVPPASAPKPIDPHQKRRSQVLDVSPSSSDSEDPRAKALLRVQRRRQSSRRLSQFTLGDGPGFRPLDVLICEDHPVSRLVMERLMEKLRCRTIVVTTGPDAVRYATSDVQFDIIMMEVKLPQLNGPEVAKMIRTMRNANQQTPIVAVTGYLKELPQSHHFDSLIQKPPTLEKLSDVISKLCHWRPPPPDWQPEPYHRHHTPSGLRQEANAADSPSSLSSEPFPHLAGASWKTTSREDSVTSSSFFEHENNDNGRIIIQNTGEDWPGNGLGISEDPLDKDFTHPGLPHLLHFNSAPPLLGLTMPSPRKSRSSEAIRAKRAEQEKNRHECAESGDDEDEDAGRDRSVSPTSPRVKGQTSHLGTQMMRTGSQTSVINNSMKNLSIGGVPQLPPSMLDDQSPTTPNPPAPKAPEAAAALNPPELFPKAVGEQLKAVIVTEENPRPHTERIPSTVLEESDMVLPPRHEE